MGSVGTEWFRDVIPNFSQFHTIKFSFVTFSSRFVAPSYKFSTLRLFFHRVLRYRTMPVHQTIAVELPKDSRAVRFHHGIQTARGIGWATWVFTFPYPCCIITKSLSNTFFFKYTPFYLYERFDLIYFNRPNRTDRSDEFSRSAGTTRLIIGFGEREALPDPA